MLWLSLRLKMIGDDGKEKCREAFIGIFRVAVIDDDDERNSC